MILKILILALLCLVSIKAYTEENGVLILSDDDLSNITDIFPHLFVKFYVPWCRHCKQLSPIFEQIAQQLITHNSTIRLAKINCDVNEKAYQFENVEHFPTLVFYDHGQPLNFDGDRTKNYMLKWLTKRLTSPVVEISLEELEKMRSSQEVSLVFHGQLQSIKGATFTNIAYQDNYNNYYFIKQPTKPYGTVELLRSFSEDVECPYPKDEEFHSWILQHDRPSVVPLDDRSISSIFRDGRLGVMLFLQDKYSQKRIEFKNAADYWKNKGNNKRLLFVNVPEQHQDYYGLLQYMDVNPLETPILIINSEEQKKYLLQLGVGQLISEKIIKFLEDFEAGNIDQSPLESQHAHHHHDHDHHHQNHQLHQHHQHHGHHQHHHHDHDDHQHHPHHDHQHHHQDEHNYHPDDEHDHQHHDDDHDCDHPSHKHHHHAHQHHHQQEDVPEEVQPQSSKQSPHQENPKADFAQQDKSNVEGAELGTEL